MEAFWTTEYGQNLLSVEQTEIDKLLSSPNTTTLEDLFDEDELLQQCSNKNTQLINFLSKRENITKLVSYITRPWQEHMDAIIEHLKEKELLQQQSNNDNTNNNNNNNNNNNPPTSPLSKNGTNRVGPIQEEPTIMQLDDQIDNINNINDNQNQIDNNKNENQTNMDDKNEDKNDVLTHVINENTNENNDNSNDDNKDNIEQNDEKMDDKKDEIKDENDDNNNDEFNDNNYDNLKLSDDENYDNNDDDTNENDNDKPGPPKLKKKGSIVDMLMDGPDFVDDTELDEDNNDENNENNDDNSGENETEDNNNNNDNDNKDNDPELPDLEVNDNNNNSEKKPLLYDIPPPPPPPTAPPPSAPIPTKLEEFKSEIGIEKVKLKYPYLASEIINCQIPQILDIILNENNPFLDMLFDFIVQLPPLNAVLTNYWRSAIVGLVRRNSNTILKYIKQRKNLLTSLVQHIRDQSIMELVIALGWDPAIEELKELDEVADWMYNEALVPKLIETLSPLHTPDEHSAASYTLVDIVAKTSRSTNLVLFYNLASEKEIDSLMNHMFGGNRSSLLESLSVLLALLHHYPNVSAEKQQFGDSDIDNNINNNNIPPPPPPQPQQQLNTNPLAPKQSQSDENNINPLAMQNQTKNKTKDTTQSDENNQDNNDNTSENVPEIQNEIKDEIKEELDFDASIPAVVKAVCYRLSEFKILLEDDNLPSLRLPFVSLSPPLGPVRHKVVDMIVALMRTPSKVVSSKLRSLGLICKCIDLFFLYPWNNLLHGSVEHIIQMVVSGDCEILKAALFEDCDFLNRILKARELSKKHQEKSGFRLGYMGHITRVSNTIVEFAKRNKQLLEYMQLNEDWMKFIADDLKLENEQLNTQLGGHRPSALNGDDDVDDFTLFTLNDITNHNDDINDINVSNINTDGDINDDDDDDDSDSDSDDDRNDPTSSLIKTSNNNDITEATNNMNDTNITNYEMPQDAFTKLTEKIDEQNNNNNNSKKNENNKSNKNEDFDNWLNDDENWNDFNDNDKEQNNNKNKNKTKSKPVLTKEINGDINSTNDSNIKDENKENKENNQNNENTTKNENNKANNDNNADDFDNWDNDPFADDIFENDNDNNNNNNNDIDNKDKDKDNEKDIVDKDKLNNGHINNKIEQQTVGSVND